MTRYVVLREGEKVPSGLYIQNGAIKMLDSQVLLHLNFRYGDEVLGSASDFQRDGDEISMNFVFTDRWYSLFHDENDKFRSELWEFSMYCSDVETEAMMADDKQIGTRVTSCRLRSISVVPIAAISRSIREELGR